MAAIIGSASPPCPPAVRSNTCSPGISEEGHSPDSASSSTPTGHSASATPTPLVVDTALAQGAQWEGNDDLGARILALTSPASAPANLGLWPEGEDSGSGWGSRVSSPALSLTGGFGNLPSLPTPSPIPVGPSLASLATTFAPIASPTVPLPAPDFSWLTNLASASATPSPTHTASSRSSPVQEPMAAMVATMLGMIESEESRQRAALVGNEAEEQRVLAGMAPKAPSPHLNLHEEQRLLAQQEAQVNQLFGSLLEPVVQQPQPQVLQPHVFREATNVPTRPPPGKAPFAPTISRGAVHIMDKCGTRMPVCLDYLKGMCGHKRSRCKFAHPQLPQATAELLRMEKDGRQVCALWVLTGYCKFGDKCRDMHPVLPEGIANGAFNTNFNASGNPLLGGEAPEAPAATPPAAPEAAASNVQREAFGTTLDQNKLQQQRQAALAAAASVGFGAPQGLGGGFKPAAPVGNTRNPFSSLDNRFNKERGNTRKEGGFRKKPIVNGDVQAPTNAHGLLRPVSPQK